MNYHTHYQRLMDRAKDRVLVGYSERHHIMPRCLGGGDSPDNIAVLTAEEHYVAHLLLVKMYPGNSKLVWAAVAMTNTTTKQQRSKNKLYGWLRWRLSEQLKGRVVSDATRARLSALQMGNKNMAGKTHSAATKIQMSAAAQGRKKSLAHRTALSIAKRGVKRGPHSEEHKQKIRLSNIETAKRVDRTFMQSAEYKKRQAEKMKQVWANRRLGLSPMPISMTR